MVKRIEEEIIDCIENKDSFILDAGAGSGKTSVLVQSLNYILQKKSKELKRNNQHVICITYTKVARDEIIDRIEHNDLIIVTTIHDFLWDCIGKYKKELKEKLLENIKGRLDSVINSLKTTRAGSGREIDLLERKAMFEDIIQKIISNDKPVIYRNFPSYKNSIISHDEVIDLSGKIFSSYKLLTKIITNSFPIIFVDEYQDTQEEVVKILLDNLYGSNNFLVGFFGDKMQNIYDIGIGEIPPSYRLRLIKKLENYRCSINVINLLNKLRTDIHQIPAGNKTVEGRCSFYHAVNNIDISEFIETYMKKKNNIEIANLKILYLTHNLIAKKNNYFELLDLYTQLSKRDYIINNIDNRGRCPFADLLYDIEYTVDLFNEKKIQLLLKELSFELKTIKDKNHIKILFDKLLQKRKTETIGAAINFVLYNNLLIESDKLKEYDLEDEKKWVFFERLMELDYNQFLRLYEVQKNSTPFSTKHGTKGAEYENVLVIIDDNAWNFYNFDNYFSNNMSNPERFKRTRNLFYVVCSRAKANLFILCLTSLSSQSLKNLNDWFGKESVFTI